MFLSEFSGNHNTYCHLTQIFLPHNTDKSLHGRMYHNLYLTTVLNTTHSPTPLSGHPSLLPSWPLLISYTSFYPPNLFIIHWYYGVPRAGRQALITVQKQNTKRWPGDTRKVAQNGRSYKSHMNKDEGGRGEENSKNDRRHQRAI